jgi:hypothetical protein
MLVSQLNFKTLKIEVFQKKIRFFLPFSLSLSFLGKDFSRISPSFLSLRETSHHRFRLKSSPKIKKMTPTTTISSSPFFRSQIETIHTQKYSLSLSHDIRETKGTKQKKTRQKRGRKNQKKREREIYLFPTNGGEDFASLSLSLFLFFFFFFRRRDDRNASEKRNNARFFLHRAVRLLDELLSLSLSLKDFLPRGGAQLSSSLSSRGENIFEGEKNPREKKKKRRQIYSLCVCVLFTLTQTDCLLADVVLTAALLSGIKPEADKVQAIFY